MGRGLNPRGVSGTTLKAGLWQKNDDAKKNIESDSETLAVVDADIAKNQAKLDALKRDLDAKKAKLAKVNAQIGEKTTDVASLLAGEASPFHFTFVHLLAPLKEAFNF